VAHAVKDVRKGGVVVVVVVVTCGQCCSKPSGPPHCLDATMTKLVRRGVGSSTGRQSNQLQPSCDVPGLLAGSSNRAQHSILNHW
jgi:threonine dehydrogenase-like Zn-dependent dehydrogenase